MKQALMRSMMRWVALCFVLSTFGMASVHASELSDALKKSDHVLLMRHALAPGIGDPAAYTLKDCNTQRNLDGKGREQAQRPGQWLKAQGGRVKPRQINTPTLTSGLPNPGHA